MERREFLKWLGAAAAALALPGCEGASTNGAATYSPGVYGNEPLRTYAPIYARAQPLPQAGRRPLPDNAYPVVPATPAPVASGGATMARPVASVTPAPSPVLTPTRPAPTPAAAPRTSVSGAVYARSAWGAEAPIRARLQPMGGVTRITVHHDGNPKPNLDKTPAEAAKSIRLIQAEHRKRMGAGDIGYHFIVDRSGRVWQGREECYQGAHVSSANAKNIGVLCLGNYDSQQPTPAQLASLEGLLRQLMLRYRVPSSRVQGHRDLANTRCPGDHLAASLAAIRRRLG